jgi:hypothetical protein
MSKGRELRYFDYVNHPYENVRDALCRDAPGVFQAATRVAASRAHEVASELRVHVGALEIAAEIKVTIKQVEVRPAESLSTPVTRLHVEWEAARRPGLFPLMRAELAVYPLTATETQLDLTGRYEPPLGLIGGAVDALVGHRIAEASVHRFVTDVADYLRRTLGSGRG